MNAFLRREWPHLALLGGLYAVAAYAWPRVPARLPVHWGLDGTPDRYGGKVEGVLIIPLIATGLYALLAALPRIDPRRSNYADFARPYATIRFALLALLGAIYGAVLLAAAGRGLDMARVAPGLVGLLLIVIGSQLGKLRPAWFVGIRTPWTMTSARSWGKTHRAGGWAFIVVGGCLLVGGVCGLPQLAVAGLVGLVVALACLFLYSYVVWREDQGSAGAERGA